MASFLISMRKASKGITDHYSFSCFSIKEYIYTLFREMKVYHPKVREQYLPMRTFLEKGFMDAHDHLDFAFCHGDFHPLNVIWHNHQINAVIDWEFIGIKPDCYDAANLVGCAGIEHPQGLAMPMVTSFLSNLQKTSVISAAGWRWFPEYVLALRFAWLSEWLKKQDEQMLETEAVFMNILIDQMGELRKIWSIKR
ncbi:MAG: aminoglycoside phosphotransferase family protein [Desulfobacter sp.]|nr:aminoglycoside phosphotransferase family protein [Desulfobacter sp.]